MISPVHCKISKLIEDKCFLITDKVKNYDFHLLIMVDTDETHTYNKKGNMANEHFSSMEDHDDPWMTTSL